MVDDKGFNFTLDMTRPENMQVWVIDAAKLQLPGSAFLFKTYFDILRDKCEAKAVRNLLGGGFSERTGLLRGGGVNCQGTTQKGQPCKKSAGPTGYCHLHD